MREEALMMMRLAEAMKGKGLGTPATRADTIEKLISRNFIQQSSLR